MAPLRKKTSMATKSIASRSVRVTDFQRSVYDMCCKVPAAAALKKPGASRAVGNALRNNPFAPDVPCHRVVASNRTLGGFHGAREGPFMKKKINMLKEESVKFDSDGKVNAECVVSPTGLQ